MEKTTITTNNNQIYHVSVYDVRNILTTAAYPSNIRISFLRKPVKSRFLRSFLFYVPYACLTAMTVPAIFTCTQSPVSAIAGFAVAIVLGLRNKGLMTVAAAGCITVFAVERLLALLNGTLFGVTVLLG